MRAYKRWLIILAAVTAVVTLFVLIVSTANVAVFNPMGSIAAKQRDLLVFALSLSAIVVIPVFTLTFWIVRRYRVDAKRAVDPKYEPTWDRHRGLEALWWGIPLVLISILSVVIWQSSHELDPFRAIESSKEPVNVQVVALDWKWLFIYPDHQIATVNELYIPVGRPVNFQLTADAPMNSMWIPQLGGQVYAMAGMSTQLHLIADKTGIYDGKTANISGRGYSGMRFKTHAVSEQEYDTWVAQTKMSGKTLDDAAYATLAKPTENVPPSRYGTVGAGLYDKVVMKYMEPGHDNKAAQHELEGTHETLHQH